MQFPLCGPSYESESPNVNPERTANWYTEKQEVGDSASAIALYPTPGLTPFASIAGTSVRGLYEFNGRTFAVGSNFAEVMSDGSVVGYGFLPVDSEPVSMAANNANQLIICTGGQLWLFPLATGAIIYTNVPSTITQIQIVDNADPSVKDYYITCAAVAGYAVGSSLIFAGVTALPFLNGISGTILGIAGNVGHMQLPRNLTLGFVENITNIVVAANAPANTSQYATGGISTGSPAWQNPGRAGSLTLYADFPAPPGPSFAAAYCEANQFGFAIPTGAAIVGIVVSFDRQVDSGTAFTDAYTNGIQLYKAGTPAGTPKVGPGTQWTTSWVTETYGGASDVWGTTWTDVDINNPAFAAGVQGYFDNNTGITHQGRIQKLQVTVYYTTFNATITLSQTAVYTQTGEPVTCAGLTHAPAMNGNAYPQVSAAGTSLVLGPCPGPAYSGSETGTVSGEIVNYGPTADTGTVAGTVISYTVNPVQVAIGQGPFSEVDFVDGKFIARISNSQEFQTSGFEDGTTWDPADKYRVSVYADNNVSMIVDHKEIVFFGSKKSIPYYDSGDLLNQFQPRIDSLIENGCGAEYSVVRLDNSVFWIGKDERGQGIAWRLNGYSPVRISNFAVENAWRKYSTISDAIAYSYQDNGHAFWVIWFPEADKTWVYDASQGEWHERFFLDNGRETAHRSRCHCFAFAKHLVGDRSSGTIYWMDISLETDNVYGAPNAPIQSLRITPPLQKEKLWLFHKMLQIDLQTGTGNSGSADAVTSVSLVDSSGVAWAVTISNTGVLSVTPSIGSGQAIVFKDTANNFYQWAVSTAGVLSYVPLQQPNTYVNGLVMQSPSGQNWQVSVLGGAPVIAAISAIPPQIQVRWSDDSGRTWSNNYSFSVGALGEYKERVIRWILGRSRARNYSITTNDYAAKFIVNGYVDVTL